jgi:hypothetical protein
MKKILSIIAIAALLSSSVYADVKTGQKTYLKLLKNKFNMNGTKFAAEHTVEEWTELFNNNAEGFIKEYSTKFPNAEATLTNIENKDKLQDIGDFAKEYGSDSGNVPSCG